MDPHLALYEFFTHQVADKISRASENTFISVKNAVQEHIGDILRNLNGGNITNTQLLIMYGVRDSHMLQIAEICDGPGISVTNVLMHNFISLVKNGI